MTATQDGDGAFAAATPVEQSFTVTKAKGDQTISLGVTSSLVVGHTTAVSASATSGLAVDVSVSGSCSLSGSTLTATTAGSCTVTATQVGDADWNPAPPVTQTVTITQAAASPETTTTTSVPTTPSTTAPAPASASPLASTLPVTGAPIGPAAGGAFALIGIGAVLVVSDRLRTRRSI